MGVLWVFLGPNGPVPFAGLRHLVHNDSTADGQSVAFGHPWRFYPEFYRKIPGNSHERASSAGATSASLFAIPVGVSACVVPHSKGGLVHVRYDIDGKMSKSHWRHLHPVRPDSMVLPSAKPTPHDTRPPDKRQEEAARHARDLRANRPPRSYGVDGGEGSGLAGSLQGNRWKLRSSNRMVNPIERFVPGPTTGRLDSATTGVVSHTHPPYGALAVPSAAANRSKATDQTYQQAQVGLRRSGRTRRAPAVTTAGEAGELCQLTGVPTYHPASIEDYIMDGGPLLRQLNADPFVNEGEWET